AIELRREHERLDLGMLEADALDRIGELDVDRQIVRVELQLVAGLVRVVAVDRHDERGHLTVDGQLPVLVATRMRLELSPFHADGVPGNLLLVYGRLRALYFGHEVPRSRRRAGSRGPGASRLV